MLDTYDQECAIQRVIRDAEYRALRSIDHLPSVIEARRALSRGLTPPVPRPDTAPIDILTAPFTNGHERIALAAAISATPVEGLWKASEELLHRIRRRANAGRPVSRVNNSFDEMCERLEMIQTEMKGRYNV